MSYTDEALHYAIVLLDAAARGDHKAGADAYRTIERSNVDPIHVAQHLASILAPFIKQNPGWEAVLDEQLVSTRLIADAGLGSDERLFEEPQGRKKRKK